MLHVIFSPCPAVLHTEIVSHILICSSIQSPTQTIFKNLKYIFACEQGTAETEAAIYRMEYISFLTPDSPSYGVVFF